MSFREHLTQVVCGGTLSHSAAAECCELMLTGHATPLEVSGLLCAMHARGEHVEELSGFLSVMRKHMLRVACKDPKAIDLCGTGGDGHHSFNLSTAAALLAAACGATVAKHGNRAVSSRSGSADVLEALRIPLHANAQTAGNALAKYNFAFLFAPHFHPAMKSVAPIRKELGVRTIFNLLGPLANPAGVTRQLIGVFNPKWMRPLVETLADAGSEQVMTLHSEDGLDEVTLQGKTHYCTLNDGSIETGVWHATAWGLTPTPLSAIAGEHAADNAARLLRFANGQEPELAEWIFANTAPALVLAERATEFTEAVAIARDCVSSGRFKSFLEQLRETA